MLFPGKIKGCCCIHVHFLLSCLPTFLYHHLYLILQFQCSMFFVYKLRVYMLLMWERHSTSCCLQPIWLEIDSWQGIHEACPDIMSVHYQFARTFSNFVQTFSDSVATSLHVQLNYQLCNYTSIPGFYTGFFGRGGKL